MNQPRLVGGRYQLLDPLGRGGMGIVWRAQDTTIGREVAIKEIRFPPSLSPADQAALRDRTLHEARTAAGIRHPAVVAIHDVIDDFGEPWIVMELVRGRSLDQVVKTGGPLSPEWAASIGLFVASALATAHTGGLLHRDVKPGNVLLADDGRILLSDFGIATRAGGPQHGAPVGTPGFTAPECLTETREQLAGPASDLWSLGATIYTAVEGVPPFQRNTAMAMHGAVLTEEPRPPQRAGALGPILMALLSKNPAQRPDVAGLRRTLQQVTGATGPTQRTPATTWVVSKLAAYGSAAAAVVAFVAAVTLILVTSSAPATPVAVTSPSAAPTSAPAPSSSESAGAEPSASVAPSVSHTPGKFTALPRLCQLLTRQQATQLIGRFLTSAVHDDTECIWGNADNTAPDSQQMAIYSHFWLYQPQGDGYETQLAHEHIEGARKKAEETAGRGGSGSKQGEVFEIPGAGDEAIAWELSKTRYGGKREFEVNVVFRTGNIVGEFRFNREVANDPRLRDKAAQAAKWLAENLNRRA